MQGSEAHALAAADGFIRSGQWAEAVESLERAVALSPDAPRLRVALIESLRGANRISDAAEVARDALLRWPEDLSLRLESAAVQLDGSQVDAAIADLRFILARQADYFEARFNLGLALLRKGEPAAAAEQFATAVRLRPDSAHAQARLGTALTQMGRMEPAVDAFRAAVQRRPADAGLRGDLGVALAQLKRWPEAIAELTRAVALAPDAPEPRRNLGFVLFDAGAFPRAVDILHQALRDRPDDLSLIQRLGVALGKLDRHVEAVRLFERAVASAPASAVNWTNLSQSLERAGRSVDALTATERGLQMLPGDAFLHCRLADLLSATERWPEAADLYKRAIALDPTLGIAHMGLGIMLLGRGDLIGGWNEYEWRWQVNQMRTPRRDFGIPEWNGQPLDGRSILLHAEQGFGDALQFVRYVPLVAQRGGRVILECHPEMLELLDGMRGAEQVVAQGAGPLPSFDLHLPLMSLGRVMKTDLHSIPSEVPYVAAPLAQRDAWRRRVELDGIGLRVGICRAGRVQDALSRRRAFSGSLLEAFAGLPNVIYYELALPDPLRSNDPLPPVLRMIDHAAHLRNFAETAGLLEALDLVITIDSAVAHLAGALGRETWLLVSQVPDWRWMHVHGDRSLWYPTMRVFRQGPGGWGELLQRVAVELKSRLAQQN